MEIITGYTGENHVTSADDASLYRGILGRDDYVLDVGNKFAATIIDNNTVRIMDGDLVIQGHQARIRANDYEEVTIDNGTPGQKRNDLIVARYQKNTTTGIESITLEVVKGTPGETATDPDIIQEDLSTGGTQRDFALYRVSLNGPVLESVTSLFTVIPNLKDFMTQLADKVDKVNPTMQSNISAESVEYGPNLVDGTGWVSEGWTGDFSTGFTHIKGNTEPLITTVGQGSNTNIFQISFDVTRVNPISGGAPNEFTITLGGSAEFETYRDFPDTYSFGILHGGKNNELRIIPHTDFDGTITNISVREIISPSLPTITIKDSNNITTSEFRYGNNERRNVYIGSNSGEYNTTGDRNVGVGFDSMRYNTSGFWNTAIGNSTLRNNTVGTRNVAIGHRALEDNISGDRNISIGTFSLRRNTTGRNNIALGADSLWYNTDGYSNIAIGSLSLGSNETGHNNIGIGGNALTYGTNANNSIAIGAYALGYSNGAYNIAIGRTAMYRNDTGRENVAIGYNALFWNNGNHNIAMGSDSLQYNTTGTGNIALGHRALRQNTTANNNIALGRYALENKVTGITNIAIGYSAGRNVTGNANICIGAYALESTTNSAENVAIGQNALRNVDGTRNVAIGRNTGINTGTGSNNTFIGASAGSSANSGDNNILIGSGVQKMNASASNQLNIGNIIKSADMTTGLVEIPKLKLTDLPTSPSGPGVLWNNNGTLRIG